jgi:hypothetical protein
MKRVEVFGDVYALAVTDCDACDLVDACEAWSDGKSAEESTAICSANIREHVKKTAAGLLAAQPSEPEFSEKQRREIERRNTEE